MPSKLRVLIVEDEFLISLALSQQLENLGYDVAGMVRDGNQGVIEALRLRPDVVLMDIGLPDIDGIEAAKQILAGSSIPIVMLSAYDDEKRLDEAQAIGVAGYLLKPATQRQLQETLEKALSRNHS